MEPLKTDILLIGAGIMSATLGVMLRELDPTLHITIIEKLDRAADESSDAWNNAGTGHSAFCELNYTPETGSGIDISKAVTIAESFEHSRELWSYLVKKNKLKDPSSFIRSVPHMSCVWGAKDRDFLKKRYLALIKHPLFKGMDYSEDPAVLKRWIPLMMEGRKNETMAATYMASGTDVNFGELTRQMIAGLNSSGQTTILYNHEVTKIRRQGKLWKIRARSRENGNSEWVAPFVFIGAGGGALPLLIKSGIPEAKGFGGFPVSGQWLICKNPDVIKKHNVKVYGKAGSGTPPMSVPHLDTRIIRNEKHLLFGPYAGLTSKFLKQGSGWDLFKSIRFNNIIPMLSAALHNFPLTKYLFRQVTLSPQQRLEMLKVFVPGAQLEDWELAHAGQRVQIIKKDREEGGVIEFGTEVVTSADGSVAALLGASPGASVSVSIMIELLGKCFSAKMLTPGWKQRLEEMIPSLRDQDNKGGIVALNRESTSRILQLNDTTQLPG